MMKLSSIFFSFALIISPASALYANTTYSSEEFCQFETRKCGCSSKNKVQKDRPPKTREAEERCGICAPQPVVVVPDENEDTVVTKCDCGKPKKRTALHCGCGGQQPTSDDTTITKCGICAPSAPVEISEEAEATKCGICTAQPAPAETPENVEVIKCGICTAPAPAPVEISEATEATKCGICTAQPVPAETPENVEVIKCGICTAPAPAPVEISEATEATKCGICTAQPAPAETPSETGEKKAIDSLIGSVLLLAGQLAKQDYCNAINFHRSIFAITHQLLNNVTKEHTRFQLLANKPHLSILDTLKDAADRRTMMKEIINNPESCQLFLEEIFTAVKEYLATHGTTLYDALDAIFSEFIAQRTISQQNIQFENLELKNNSTIPFQFTIRVHQH